MDYKQYFDGKTQSLSTTQYVNDMDIKMVIYMARMYYARRIGWMMKRVMSDGGQPVFGTEFPFTNYIGRVCVDYIALLQNDLIYQPVNRNSCED